MSDNIPFEIQVEIIKRLPVKSLLQFRSVSKSWKTMIDSLEFITGYSLRHTPPQGLIVQYYDPDSKFLTFVDDQTSPQHRFVPTIPLSVQRLNSPMISGSSQGLLCLHGYYQDPCYSYSQFRFAHQYRAVIWNPSIRKAVVPIVPFSPHANVIGFGVSPITGDPTIVEISRDVINMSWLVRVFKLSTGVWTNPSNNLPRRVYKVTCSQAAVDKFIYWIACNAIIEIETNNLILSFDMTDDKFGVVNLPHRLAYKPHKHLSISKLRESLVVLSYSMKRHVCDVWLMETGDQNSFKTLFTIKEPHAKIKILGFNKSDNPIMQMHYKGEDREEAALAVYDRSAEVINDLGVNGMKDSFNVNTYMETLLLLDH